MFSADEYSASKRSRAARSSRLFSALLVFGLEAGGAAAQDQAAQGHEPALLADGAALDAHTHIASPALTAVFTGGQGDPMGADDLVVRLDEGYVQGAIILSGGYLGAPVGWTHDSHMAPENDYIAAEVARYPDRLIGFCGINPHFASAPDEVTR